MLRISEVMLSVSATECIVGIPFWSFCEMSESSLRVCTVRNAYSLQSDSYSVSTRLCHGWYMGAVPRLDTTLHAGEGEHSAEPMMRDCGGSAALSDLPRRCCVALPQP